MLVGWLVGQVFKLQRTALTIFLIFCMELGIDKVNKVTEPDFRKKKFFSRKWGKRAKNSPKSFLFEVFSETALTILFFFAEEEDIIVIHTCTKFHVQEKSGSRDMGSKGVKNGGFRDFLTKFNFYSVHSPRQ